MCVVGSLLWLFSALLTWLTRPYRAPSESLSGNQEPFLISASLPDAQRNALLLILMHTCIQFLNTCFQIFAIYSDASYLIFHEEMNCVTLGSKSPEPRRVNGWTTEVPSSVFSCSSSVLMGCCSCPSILETLVLTSSLPSC